MKEEKIFKLKGKTLAIIDWANVYGWFEKLKWEIDPKKLYDYLKSYPEIYDVRFYFGLDPKSYDSWEFCNDLIKLHDVDKNFNFIHKLVKLVPQNFKFRYFKNKNTREILELKQIPIEAQEMVLGIKETMEEFSKKFPYLQICRRKCDCDVDITVDVLNNLKNFENLILFSGDGDFASLIHELVINNKQVIIVSPKGNLGREYQEMINARYPNLHIFDAKKLKKFIQK